MNEEHIELSMRPDIIVKASPNLQQFDAKAVAANAESDIIERNVIAEFREPEEGDESEEQQ